MARSRSEGFSLLELLVALAVSGALLGFVYQICLAQQKSYLLREQLADAQQSARSIVDELTRHLASLGAGADLERGQVRLLVAHPYELVFNADLRSDRGAMPPGAAVPGAAGADPYLTQPPGTYGTSSRSETYRFTLDRNGDNRVDQADRTTREHYTLYREVNGGDLQEIAGFVANPRVGEPLFRYWGDFNGDGIVEVSDRVDKATSSLLAANQPLDAVVRRVEINLVVETATPDPNYPRTAGYRQVRLVVAVSPENLATARPPTGRAKANPYLPFWYVPMSSAWARIFPSMPFSKISLVAAPRSGSTAFSA